MDFQEANDLEHLLDLCAKQDTGFTKLYVGNLTFCAVVVKYPDEFCTLTATTLAPPRSYAQRLNAERKLKNANIKKQNLTKQNFTLAFCTLHLAMEPSDRSLYWLKLVERTDLISGKELQPLLAEAKELIKILAKSVVTAKGEMTLQFAFCNFHFSMERSDRYSRFACPSGNLLGRLREYKTLSTEETKARILDSSPKREKNCVVANVRI